MKESTFYIYMEQKIRKFDTYVINTFAFLKNAKRHSSLFGRYYLQTHSFPSLVLGQYKLLKTIINKINYKLADLTMNLHQIGMAQCHDPRFPDSTWQIFWFGHSHVFFVWLEMHKPMKLDKLCCSK